MYIHYLLDSIAKEGSVLRWINNTWYGSVACEEPLRMLWHYLFRVFIDRSACTLLLINHSSSLLWVVQDVMSCHDCRELWQQLWPSCSLQYLSWVASPWVCSTNLASRDIRWVQTWGVCIICKGLRVVHQRGKHWHNCMMEKPDEQVRVDAGTRPVDDMKLLRWHALYFMPFLTRDSSSEVRHQEAISVATNVKKQQ